MACEGSPDGGAFPADCPHRIPCGLPDTRRSQHIAELFNEKPSYQSCSTIGPTYKSFRIASAAASVCVAIVSYSYLFWVGQGPQ